MKYHLNYLLSVCFLFLIGILFYERKKPKQLGPMKVRTIIPPNYSCKPQPNLDTRELSAKVKGYTINPFKKEDLEVVRTKDGPMEYLPSEKVSEISYHVKNEFAYGKQKLTA